MLEIGTLVAGQYKILNKIGQGGMSVVYLAMNEKVNKNWAIKEVRKDGTKDFEIVKQGLMVETDMLKKLKHPNLPSIIDIIEDEETFLIVMDYIEGNPLSKSLEEFGAQPEKKVIQWAKQLCDVLGYLHTRNPAIIYRDMKPANIMLKPDGNLALIDFGTAREFKEKNPADTVCLGTIGYAAPEQFGGQGQTDVRTDIYCLGATLFHLLTGRNPSEPPYEMVPIRQIDKSLSTGLERIILKCTQRNPDDRFQSSAELMYALEHYEEIDDEYRKAQKLKLWGFLITIFFSFAFIIGGVVSNMLADKMNTDNYNETIDMAMKASAPEKQEEYYISAIAIKPEEPRAYLGLIDTYKQDSIFSVEEEGNIISLLKNHKTAIISRQEIYADVCFETGKLYWYYYNYGNIADNRTTRMKTAINWFADALEYGGAEYENRNMAAVYKEIGVFYRDIPSKAIEGADRGLYAPFYEKLLELIDLVEQDENESEIVKLELYELVRYSIMQYATKFKGDGIEQDDLFETFYSIEERIQDVRTTTDKTLEMKESSVALLEETKKAIEVAYGTGKEVSEDDS